MHQKRRPHVFHFFPVTHGRIVYQGSGLRTQLDYPRNGLTLRYLFLCFVTRGVLQSLILERWKVHDPQGKKHITHQDLLEMMVLKVWLHSTPTKYHDDCWPLPPPFTMSRGRYERLSKVVFRKPTAMVLDKNYARMVVQFPELVIVDEKHKGLKHPCEYQSYEPS